jgi:hypothetical protein
MRWSRLKSLLESRQAESVRGRVTLHQARYRHAQEEVGRVWVAIDAREVAAFATHMGWARVQSAAERLMDERGAWGSPEAYSEACAEAETSLRATGEFSDAVALEDLEASLSLPVETALTAASPLVRALALLDARIGKRRLLRMAGPPDPHPLVRSMHALRCEAEGIRLPTGPLPL